MDEKEMEEVLKEALRLAEKEIEDVIYKSLLAGATNREAQRIESELRDRCRTNIKN